jgi:hypothetical protein
MRLHWTAAAALLLALPWLAGCDMKHPVTGPVAGGGGQLVVNEFLASNSSFGADEFDENDDWIELYNAGDAPINLAGYTVTDDLTKPRKYEIPSGSPSVTTIAPHGYLLIWCDSQADQGPLHTTFNLSAGGEQIGVYEPSGEVVTELTYGPQTSDVSYGRTTDGADTWRTFTTPTPGASNGGGGGGTGPTIATPTLDPATPGADATVHVSSVITDDGTVSGATLHYAVDGGSFTTVTMTHVGSTWTGDIPGQSAGAAVTYYLSAVDDASHTTTLPANAPTTTLTYHVAGGGGTPTLYVNELLASNSAGLTDPYGEYDDWFEIYNPGSSPVDLGGMYVTDDLATPNKWQIPTSDPTASTVPAHGYLILWADGQPDQGVVHVNFKLSAAGEAIGLYTATGETIDTVTFGAQGADVSYGRVPDGSANWVTISTPTPGASNGGTALLAGSRVTR